MSGALTALASVGTFAMPALSATGLMPAWIRQGRKIGTIIPDVTIEEQHSDRLQVTQHPIADGSPISDHAYRLPGTVTMRCGWSNANVAGAAVSGFMSGGISGAAAGAFSSFTETRAKEIYNRLLALQATAQLIELTTGKRDYSNMALTELSISTDHTKEYSLFVEAHFTQVFLVKTRSTTQTASSDMAGQGSKTAETTTEPAKQPAQRESVGTQWGLGGRYGEQGFPPRPPPGGAPRAGL